ncbi:hypothetical protein, partial [Pseudomonas sp. NPDC087817]|uniref:hypothetical protein n=1 Tax=Pseudomonas sp. NPDC087817 TaxID=3364451 RepID=UPI0038281765
DQGGDGMTHITPQRADSATFASYDSSAQAEVADAFLSFFWVAAGFVPSAKKRRSGRTSLTHLQLHQDSATLVP